MAFFYDLLVAISVGPVMADSVGLFVANLTGL